MEAAKRSGLIFLLASAACLLAACAGQDASPSGAAAPDQAASIVAEAPSLPDPVAPETAPESAPETPPEPPPMPPATQAAAISCTGPATQGGAIVCKSHPGAQFTLDGKPVAAADADGVAVIGLKRSAPAEVHIGVRPLDSGQEAVATVAVLPRKDTVSKLSMDCNKITAQSPAEKRHAEISWVKKDKALKIFSQPVAPVGIVKPAEGPYSSPFGATRTYEPKTKDCEPTVNVHNGQDIAIPTGTPIHAPMAGTVILADPDLYYEGGAVFLDLGYGLVSITMHMSRIDVKDGDQVKQGDVLGLSGATGRVTGPHLHWAIKYRNVHSADRGTDIWLDPVLMMNLDLPE